MLVNVENKHLFKLYNLSGFGWLDSDCVSVDLPMKKKCTIQILRYSHLKTNAFHLRLSFGTYLVGETQLTYKNIHSEITERKDYTFYQQNTTWDYAKLKELKNV